MSDVTDELIELRGLRFHFRDWASQKADAPILVLLHGYTSHARSWDAFAEAMSHGESAWVADYAISEMVADLEAFVAALRLEAFTLVGLSMGGMVAMDYAGGRPAALAALVIVDMAPELVTSGVEHLQQVLLDGFAGRPGVLQRRHRAVMVGRRVEVRFVADRVHDSSFYWTGPVEQSKSD